MRRQAKIPPKVGDKRIRAVFPIIPLTLGDETVWFETADVEEEYVEYAKVLVDFGMAVPAQKWKKISFYDGPGWVKQQIKQQPTQKSVASEYYIPYYEQKELRENHPALQDAWDKYVMVLQLVKNNKEQ